MNFNKIILAALMALLFVACSEENKLLGVMGGAEEEQGVYALNGQVGDVFPKIMKLDTTESGDSSLNEHSVFAPKGASITVYELDSLTFDTTGRFFASSIKDDEGHFVFDSLDFDSPYVLIEENVVYLDSSCRYEDYVWIRNDPMKARRGCNADTMTYSYKNKVYRAVADLRKKEEISVNTLTHLKFPLWREHVAEGKPIAEASQMAQREVLENFGIYEDLGPFEKLFDEDSELSFVNKLIQYRIKELREELGRNVEFLYGSPKARVWNSQIEKYYLDYKKMIGYKIGYLAKFDGLGQCTDARENDMGEIGIADGKYSVSVVCRSRKWTVGFKPVEYTKGLLVDNRDNKSYKTVTYNWGGVVQTWMAEDLNYAVSAGTSCQSYPYVGADCERFGRTYSWWSAMNIGIGDMTIRRVTLQGDTIYMDQKCIDTYAGGPDSINVYTIFNACGTKTTAEKLIFDYTDPALQSDLNAHQGICPDGWRIPTANDWRTLLQNLGRLYGVDSAKVVPVLFDETATGFGLKFSILLFTDDDGDVHGWTDFYETFAVADPHMYIVGLYPGTPGSDGFGLRMGKDSLYYEPNGSSVGPFTTVDVRCIKN